MCRGCQLFIGSFNCLFISGGTHLKCIKQCPNLVRCHLSDIFTLLKMLSYAVENKPFDCIHLIHGLYHLLFSRFNHIYGTVVLFLCLLCIFRTILLRILKYALCIFPFKKSHNMSTFKRRCADGRIL